MVSNTQRSGRDWPAWITSIVAIVGLVVTVFLAWWQLGQSADLTRAQLSQSDQVKLAQIYSDAVNQLAASEAGVRVGAVYSLIRVANESDKGAANTSYRWAVVSLLAAHIRARSLGQLNQEGLCVSPVPLVDKPEFADYRAAIEAVRTLAVKGDKVNLSNSCLLWADLRGMNLEEASLNGADMRSAIFNDADLTGADIRYSRLEFAFLDRAKLTRARLVGSNFNCASGTGVDFTGVVIVDDTNQVVLSANQVNFPEATAAPQALSQTWTPEQKQACTLPT